MEEANITHTESVAEARRSHIAMPTSYVTDSLSAGIGETEIMTLITRLPSLIFGKGGTKKTRKVDLMRINRG